MYKPTVKEFFYIIALTIIIVEGVSFFVSPSSDYTPPQESEFFVGLTTNPDFLAHGDVINIENYSCYEGDVTGGSETYFLYDDVIVSRALDYNYNITNVRSGINKNNPNELVVTVDSPESGMRFPPIIKCTPVEKEIPGVSFYKESFGVSSVKYNNLCGDGEPILPHSFSSYSHDGLVKTITTVSLSESGDNLVVERETYDSQGENYPYLGSYEDKLEEETKENMINLKISCVSNPTLNRSKS